MYTTLSCWKRFTLQTLCRGRKSRVVSLPALHSQRTSARPRHWGPRQRLAPSPGGRPRHAERDPPTTSWCRLCNEGTRAKVSAWPPSVVESTQHHRDSLPTPNPHQPVAPSRGEPLNLSDCGRLSVLVPVDGCQTADADRRSPGDGRDAKGVSREERRVPSTIIYRQGRQLEEATRWSWELLGRTVEGQHGDLAVRTGAREDWPELVRGPGDGVDCKQERGELFGVVGESATRGHAPLAVWRRCSLTLLQPLPPSFSFQMKTLPSNEHDARIEPKDGWAQERPWMGPSCLQRAHQSVAVRAQAQARGKGEGRD